MKISKISATKQQFSIEEVFNNPGLYTERDIANPFLYILSPRKNNNPYVVMINATINEITILSYSQAVDQGWDILVKSPHDLKIEP